MVAHGEEATHFGSAAALQPTDMVYAQYREVGVLIWRGFSIDQVMDQCFGTRLDAAKGRQMPVHYGSKEHNYQFISSCLSTQMPQGGLKTSAEQHMWLHSASVISLCPCSPRLCIWFEAVWL